MYGLINLTVSAAFSIIGWLTSELARLQIDERSNTNGALTQSVIRRRLGHLKNKKNIFSLN